MASETAPPRPKAVELSAGEAPPAYDELTGTLELRQDGLDTQTQLRGIYYHFPFIVI